MEIWRTFVWKFGKLPDKKLRFTLGLKVQKRLVSVRASASPRVNVSNNFRPARAKSVLFFIFLRFCPAGRNVGRSAYPLRFASVVGLSAPLDRPSPFAPSLSVPKTLTDYLVVNSEGETDTEVVVAAVGSADDAKGYAHEPNEEVPAATTKNAVLTLRRSGWIGLRIALI